MAQHCNRYLRYYFCEAAQLVRIHEPEYGAFYQKKYNEASKHRHKRAIVLTARKLVRLVVHLLATRQTYQPPEARSRSQTTSRTESDNTPSEQVNS